MNQLEYNTCVQLYADHLYRFVFKNIKQEEQSKDIVQNTFVILWQKRYDVEMDKAKSFLFTIAYRRMIDEIRKYKKIKLVDQLPDAVMGHTEITQTDLKKILHDALDTLPDIQKQLVLLKDYEGYNYEELATITGLNTGQVKINLYRARMSLKKILVSVESHI
jgi:RNA polymerase sigma-70 factor (ECF subfamily)